MSILKQLAPGFIKNRYRNFQRRLETLERSVRALDMAVDAFVINPRYVAADNIGFNGQHHRKRIFQETTSAIPFEAIIETGTWLGNTTGYMAQTSGRPVYTCEVNPRFHALARMRLQEMPGVSLELNDSRKFLEGRSRSDLAGKAVFFYLDAHWYEDLPLTEEIDLIARHWRGYVIMIDDFKVPDDAGYVFDDYGPGKALDLELLKPVMARHNLAAFFPSLSAREETGGRCGCVVLAVRGEVSQKLGQLASLREWRGA